MKQRLDYKPQIRESNDYYSESKQNIYKETYVPIHREITNNKIKKIDETIQYLDKAINNLPARFSSAIREIYEPIRRTYYENLEGKYIDPNPKKPQEIIFKDPDKPSPEPSGPDNPDNPDKPDKPDKPEPGKPDPDNPGPNKPDPDNPNPDNPDPNKPGNKDKVGRIILHKINYNNSNKPDDNKDKDDDNSDDRVMNIVLHPIPDKDLNDGSDTEPEPKPEPEPNPNPDDGSKPEPGPDNGPDDDDDNNDDITPGGLDPDSIKDVEYKDNDVNEIIKNEFNKNLTDVIDDYLSKLQDTINNYYYNVLSKIGNKSKEEVNFMLNNNNKMHDDITGPCGHLFDTGTRIENSIGAKLCYYKNNFNYRKTCQHIDSFLLQDSMRKRYSAMDFSVGGSRANSISDATLRAADVDYELRYAKSFNDLYRYLNSSNVVFRDIVDSYIRSYLMRSALVEKGGFK